MSILTSTNNNTIVGQLEIPYLRVVYSQMFIIDFSLSQEYFYLLGST